MFEAQIHMAGIECNIVLSEGEITSVNINQISDKKPYNI